MTLQVCIGSSCHLKGSYKVIEGFQKEIATHQVENQVTLKAAFCLGHCTQGVSVKIDDLEIESVSPETVEAFFATRILKKA